jgi:hypothetical protein
MLAFQKFPPYSKSPITHTVATEDPGITYTPPIHTGTSQRLPSIDEN